jgi:hypothetical protein
MKKCGAGMKSRGSGTTSTLRPSLSSKLLFRLVDLTISFANDHVANKVLIHCIATCIANGAITRNSGATVPSSPTTTSLRVASLEALVRFFIISVFQLLHFDVLYSMQVFHTLSFGHS